MPDTLLSKCLLIDHSPYYYSLLYFCFRAPKKKTLKFLSSFREETKNNDERLTKLPAQLTVVSESGIMANRRGADLNSKDSSGSIISLSLSLLFYIFINIVTGNVITKLSAE